MKILKYLTAAIMSVGLLFSSAVSAAEPSRENGIRNGLMSTSIWSGYGMTTGQTGQYYNSVSGSWKVPAVKWGQSTRNPYGFQYHTIWLGLGGVGEMTLLQMGTESIVNQAGAQTNFVWFELYPAVSRSIPHPVAVGDTINASIECIQNCIPGKMQTWKLTISDTNHWNWSQSYTYTSSMRSAEWVVESPTYGSILPLNNYGKVSWNNLTANGALPALTFDKNSITMHTPDGQTSNPSAFIGNAFSTCYGYSAFTPCSN